MPHLLPTRPRTPLFASTPWPSSRTRESRRAGDEGEERVLQVAESAGAPVQESLAAAAHRCRSEFALVEAGSGAALAFAQLEAGLDGEGRPSAWHFRQAGLRGGSAQTPDLPYRFAARRVEAIGSVAGDETAFNTFCVESAVDELAAGAGVDPLAFRLQHLEEGRWQHALQAAATAAGWHEAPPAGSARGLAVGSCFHSVVAQVVELRRGEDGHARAERVTLALDSYLPLDLARTRALLQAAVQKALARWLAPAEAAAPPTFELVLPSAPHAGQRTLVADGVASLALPTLAPALANALCRLGEPRRRRLASGPLGPFGPT